MLSRVSTVSAMRRSSAPATTPCGYGSILQSCRRGVFRRPTCWMHCGPPTSRFPLGRSTSPPGAFQIAVQTLGRLSEPEQFGDTVVAADRDGRVTRIRDIARVELGAQDYNRNAYLGNKVATAIAVYQRPGSNALATSESIH